MFMNLVHVNDDIETFCQVEELFLKWELHGKFEFYLKTHKVLSDLNVRCNHFRMQTCLHSNFVSKKKNKKQKQRKMRNTSESSACDIDTLLTTQKLQC